MAALNEYELQREARIAENRRRMEELGLIKLAKDFATSVNGQPRAQRKPREYQPKPPRELNLPARRSGRNAGAPAPNYNENALDMIRETTTGVRLPDRHVASQEEIYTEEDKKKLGSYEKPWELFVDGYDAEGNRVYDKVNGETCHQCRQKTVCKHTHCSQCSSLRGVFCGDCLFMRYGENLDEAMAPGQAWVCPVCRDICNCSFHRIRKGWAPTGTLYRRALADGFKSVAHYLLLTHQGPQPSSADVGATEQAASSTAAVSDENAAKEANAGAEGSTKAPPTTDALKPLAPSQTPNAPTIPMKAPTKPPKAPTATHTLTQLLVTASKTVRKTRAGAKGGKKELGVACKGIEKAVSAPRRTTRSTAVGV